MLWTYTSQQGFFEGQGGAFYNHGDIVVDGESFFSLNEASVSCFLLLPLVPLSVMISVPSFLMVLILTMEKVLVIVNAAELAAVMLGSCARSRCPCSDRRHVSRDKPSRKKLLLPCWSCLCCRSWL